MLHIPVGSRPHVTRYARSHITPVRSRGHYPIAEAFTDKATFQADSYGQAMLQAGSYRLIGTRTSSYRQATL
jgi:hypothetical protein